MSGGSFNYLCDLGSRDLVKVLDTDLESMIAELSKLPGPPDALVQTVLVRTLLIRALAQVDEIITKQGLSEVWRTVEWWRSSDLSREDAVKSVSEFSKNVRRMIEGG